MNFIPSEYWVMLSNAIEEKNLIFHTHKTRKNIFPSQKLIISRHSAARRSVKQSKKGQHFIDKINRLRHVISIWTWESSDRKLCQYKGEGGWCDDFFLSVQLRKRKREIMTDYSCYLFALLHRYIIAFSSLHFCFPLSLSLCDRLYYSSFCLMEFSILIWSHKPDYSIRHLHLFIVSQTKIRNHCHCIVFHERERERRKRKFKDDSTTIGDDLNLSAENVNKNASGERKKIQRARTHTNFYGFGAFMVRPL